MPILCCKYQTPRRRKAFAQETRHRDFFRGLFVKGIFCATRPYLSNDDKQLWLLPDAGSEGLTEEQGRGAGQVVAGGD